MQSSNRINAIEYLKSLDSEVGRALEEENSPCPDLTRELVGFLYGNLYQRDRLSLRERILITIAILISSGNMSPQLAVQTRIALKNGIECEELMEVALQTSVFSGFANAVNAANIIDSVADVVDESARVSA